MICRLTSLNRSATHAVAAIWKRQEYLDSEIRYLCELQELDDLREDDIETACLGLGLDLDCLEYFINRLAGA